MATTSELIAKIDLKIATLLDDSSNVGNYEIGDKRVDKGSYLDSLMSARSKLQIMGQSETPYEDIREIATDINEFGEDDSEYIGDAY